jgi:hypothetical protein
VQFKWVCFLIFVVATQSAVGADFLKVIKVKGKRGIVEFPSHLRFKDGQSVRIDDGVWKEKGLDGNGKRDYSIALTASYGQTSETTDSSGVSSKVESGLIDTSLKFGFNLRSSELGPETSYIVSTIDGDQTTTVRLGGFYHYNFIDNKPGVEWAPYAGGSMGLISQDSDNRKRDGLNIGVAGGIRFFPLNDHVCAIGELGFDYSTLSTDGAEITSTGISFAVGIGSYF